MAPLPVIANTYRTALNWSTSRFAQPATNVMHFRKAGSNPAALAAALDANVTTQMWDTVDAAGSITEVNITPLDGSSVSFPFLTGSPAKWTGNGGSTDIIPQVAAIVKLVTAKRGRSYRGRLFLPWLPEGQLNNGTITGATLAEANTAWVAFHTAMTSAGWAIVVASYKLATAEDVVAIALENYAATQRRRNARNSSVHS